MDCSWDLWDYVIRNLVKRISLAYQITSSHPKISICALVWILIVWHWLWKRTRPLFRWKPGRKKKINSNSQTVSPWTSKKDMYKIFIFCLFTVLSETNRKILVNCKILVNRKILVNFYRTRADAIHDSKYCCCGVCHRETWGFDDHLTCRIDL